MILQNSGAACRENVELRLVIVARMSEAICGSAAVPHIASLMRATDYLKFGSEKWTTARSNPVVILRCALLRASKDGVQRSTCGHPSRRGEDAAPQDDGAGSRPGRRKLKGCGFWIASGRPHSR